MSIGRAQSPNTASESRTSRWRPEICPAPNAAVRGRRAVFCLPDLVMRVATTEEIAMLDALVVELEQLDARRQYLRAAELEFARAVSIVDSAARALPDRRDVLKAGHAARLAADEIGERADAGHEGVEGVREAPPVAGLHRDW